MPTNDGPPKPDAMSELRHLLEAMDDDDVSVELDAHWDELAADRLSEEALALLRQQVGDDASRVAEAFAPLDPAFHDQLAQAAAEQYHGAPSASSRGGTVLLGPWFRRAAAAVLALAAVVVAYLWVAPRPGPVTVPAYQGQWHSGGVVVRDGSAPSDSLARFTTGSALEVWLTPATKPDPEALQAVVHVDGWGAAHRLEGVTIKRSDLGGMQIRGRIGEAPWRVSSGPHRLLIAVGAETWAPPRRAPSPPWQVVELDFVVE